MSEFAPPSEAERRARAATAAERQRLTTEGVPADVIKPGTTLSDATLLHPFGTETTLYQAMPAGQPAVIVFYRGGLVPVLQYRAADLSGGVAAAAAGP